MPLKPSVLVPVTKSRPIAISASHSDVAIRNLRVTRSLEYRLRPRDDRSPYPLKLKAGSCFVLGDNVPLSVDSRQLGALPTSQIVGVAVAVNSRE